VDDLDGKLMTVAVGPDSASAPVRQRDGAGGPGDLIAVDLREVANGLAPDHLPGEQLHIELIKEGRQPARPSAIWTTATMVVVSDAIHLVGTGVWRSPCCPPAYQPGIMVFAKLTAAKWRHAWRP